MQSLDDLAEENRNIKVEREEKFNRKLIARQRIYKESPVSQGCSRKIFELCYANKCFSKVCRVNW